MASRLSVLLLLALVACTFAAPEPRKIFTRCELYNWLRQQNSPTPSTWTCLAYYESSYNTAARGGPNSNGSYDNGLWQVNDMYWCTEGSAGKDCNIDCRDLRDDFIDDDYVCVMFIENRQGFSAWSTWQFCDTAENDSQWSQGC